MHLRLPAACCSLFFLYLLAACHPGRNNGEGQIDLDQQVTNETHPRDTVFRNFNQNWKKFISTQAELDKAVDTSQQPMGWEPEIRVDCQYSRAAGGIIPLVQVSWTSAQADTNVRMDIALLYRGFQNNYYSTVFPLTPNRRFALALHSNYLKDSAAVLLTGPSLFPKVVDFRLREADTSAKAVQGPALRQHTLLLTDVGPGLTYRLRMCMLHEGSWQTSREMLFSAPICPIDNH